MEEATSVAVQADALVKTYRSRAGTVEAVRGVDLRVDVGEVFGFLGPNGAGKSTTVKMLTTLLTITSGSARVAGLDVASQPGDVRRRIGVALQEAGLDPASRLTVWDEVRRINQRGTTVFLTTQYLEEADQLCDRLAIIDDGRIVREGTPTELKAELTERLGLEQEATLDDVFLDATGRSRTRAAGEVQEVSA
jgi:ABC-type multidrug transport system ATPase subunit